MKFAAIKEKLDALDRRLPVRETLMLPSDVFFSRTVPLPEGTLPTEITDFAQIQVEAAAPFPLENLSWGFSTDGKSVLIFAATQERAASFALNGLEKAWNALPAFLPFTQLPAAAEDCVRVCIAAGSASALWMKQGSALPVRIQSCRMPEDLPFATDAEILAARADLLTALDVSAVQKIDEGVYFLEGVNDRKDDSIQFTVRRILEREEKPTPLRTTLAGDALWNADIRGRTFATATGTERRKSSLIWKTFASACIAAVVLIFGSLALAAVKTSTAVYRTILSHNSKEVELLQNKSDFASNLESVTEREMKPFSMLAVANSKRPTGLYYERASASDWNILRLEGGAQRSELIQGYIEELGKDPYVHDVKTLRTATSGGNSTFDIEVVFNLLEDATTGN